MSEPFLAEVRIVGFNFAPRGYAFCDGAILQINQFQALYSLLGTTYGGDGRVSFALPDLRGRAPMHRGGGDPLGSRGGEEVHTLTELEMPPHNHMQASYYGATDMNPAGKVLGARRRGAPLMYGPANNLVVPKGSGSVGSGQPHNNMQPYLVVSFVIALIGLFPSR